MRRDRPIVDPDALDNEIRANSYRFRQHAYRLGVRAQHDFISVAVRSGAHLLTQWLRKRTSSILLSSSSKPKERKAASV
jgi:hypothetical protein